MDKMVTGRNIEIKPGASMKFWVRFTQFLLLSITRGILGIERFVKLFTFARSRDVPQGRLAIESGVKGWELIEYQELYSSACEFLGKESVSKVVVEDRSKYLHTLRRSLRAASPTHYFYDPRTGSQNNWRGLWQSLTVAVVLQWHGVVPIAFLANLPERRWRMQCFIVTAHSGVTITVMSPQHVRYHFPHRRLMGPSIMPISSQKLDHLRTLRKVQTNTGSARAVFSGSLYEPRTTILNEIRDSVRERGRELEILAGPQAGERVSNEEYWSRFSQADIIVTTSDQFRGPGIDDLGMPHLIYRYSEALAVGALLIAPTVPGIERYFIPGRHFVGFESIDDAAEKICFYLENEDERVKISQTGRDRFAGLVRTHAYWVAIDVALGTESITT